MKKALTITIVIVAALTISGCGPSLPEFIFDEKIGDEHVKFEQKIYPGGIIPADNILTVTRADGTIVKYVDNSGGNGLQLEYVEITNKAGVTTIYKDDVIGKEVLEKAQVQFDIYLNKIRTIKQQRALKAIEQK